jgi:hypothetical protein
VDAHQERISEMVKVLCRGGPYYWVKEPYTEEERAYIKDDGPDPAGYDMDLWLGAGEVYPMTELEELELYDRMDLRPGATILRSPTSPQNQNPKAPASSPGARRR